MAKPTIDVGVLACPNHPSRNDYLERVLDSLNKYLACSRHDMRLFVSAAWSNLDPNQPWDGDRLLRICASRGIELTIWNGKNSWAANANHAIHYKGGDYTLLLLDDFDLRYTLDLSDSIDFMEAHQEVDLVRHTYMCAKTANICEGGGTKFKGLLDEWRIVDAHRDWFFWDVALMRRQSFPEKYGDYQEVRNAEEMLVKMCQDKNLLVCAADKPYFGHIGSISAFVCDNRYDALSGPNLVKYNEAHGIG